MARVGIDGVTKQQQLHERNHYDHGKRDTVALELDELLHQHGPRLAPKTPAGKALGRLGRQQVRHRKLSCVAVFTFPRRLSHSSYDEWNPANVTFYDQSRLRSSRSGAEHRLGRPTLGVSLPALPAKTQRSPLWRRGLPPSMGSQLRTARKRWFNRYDAVEHRAGRI